MSAKFNIGDKVKIVNVKNCEFGYNDVMFDFLGQTTTIINEEPGFYSSIGRIYKIKADKGRFSWSANCLKLLTKRTVMVIKNE